MPDKPNSEARIALLNDMLADVFAPMIQAMNITPIEITGDGARFEVPQNADIVRGGDIICGQAIAAIADTVGVLALSAHNAPAREMTTVDMTTHFTRPLFLGPLDITASIVSNGRRMATVRIEARQKGEEKIGAVSTCAYAYV
ncbi:MAG: PaaI family thioesterase [Ahrensia sp.]|nr:PaaI family thioesterase [Ahrensia sp.]